MRRIETHRGSQSSIAKRSPTSRHLIDTTLMESIMRTTRSLVSRAAFGATIIVGLVAVTAATKVTMPHPAMFGGPWISIETPVNPYMASASGAVFLVHTFVHQNPIDLPVEGRAEGLVDGKRRSVTFALNKSAQTGTYAVRREWGEKGIWTLLVTAMPQAKNGSIQAVVNVGADGEIERVSVPGLSAGRAARLLTDAEIERGLRDRAKALVAVSAR